MNYNVQPLRTMEEIQDFQFWLRRTTYAERDSFLFLFGI
ncbi:integrase, partial [Enterococcus hirae]|nr:integrase [Enterococcus hirae]